MDLVTRISRSQNIQMTNCIQILPPQHTSLCSRSPPLTRKSEGQICLPQAHANTKSNTQTHTNCKHLLSPLRQQFEKIILFLDTVNQHQDRRTNEKSDNFISKLVVDITCCTAGSNPRAAAAHKTVAQHTRCHNRDFAGHIRNI